MSLLKKLAHNTVARLVRAAKMRHAEACHLRSGGFHLSSIYLAGYAAEMAIGASYFQTILGYGPHQQIVDRDRNRLLERARGCSKLDDKSHPIDGLVLLLIEDKAKLAPPAFDEKTVESLQECMDIVALNWGPRLRYRAIEASANQAESVLSAVQWIVDHRPYH